MHVYIHTHGANIFVCVYIHVHDAYVVQGMCTYTHTHTHRELEHVGAHYEASEIWVGKEAGVGAQIVVPEVRGDKVMWMCGGHSTGSSSSMYESAGVCERGSERARER